MVGLDDVLQTIPLNVTSDPPSEDMVPPPDAVVGVIDVIGIGVVVVTVGRDLAFEHCGLLLPPFVPLQVHK